MYLYSCEEIDQLLDRYTEAGGEILRMREGILGHGDLLLYSAAGDLKTIVIREVALNEWSSAHTVRKYDKCPKKYQRLIEKMEDAV